MKYKTLKKVRGSISVLMVIILLPMLTFSAVIVDLSRINMAKQMMSSAGDLTMNSALANYDTILKDVYGLFAMSQLQVDDKGNLDTESLGTELNNYFAKTLSAYGVVDEEDADDYVNAIIGDFREILANGTGQFDNFLELQNIKITDAQGVPNSSLANANVMRKQIVEYMKYRAPLGVGLSFLESITAFDKIDDQSKVVEAQVAAQESTQDVTKACQTLINLIRAYDKRVAEVNGALKGVSSSTDSAIIPLEDYDTHVEKYLSAWGENYTHINKINLVFLANSPSVDSVYLKNLSYFVSEHYIARDGTLYSGSKDTGISVNPTLNGDTASAKQQVTDQINTLNNSYKPYTTQYEKPKLSSTLLNYNGYNNPDYTTLYPANDSQKREEQAINSFIDYEEFLLNKEGTGLTHAQAQTVLQQIAILGKYRDNFNKWIDKDISAATTRKNNAQGVYDDLVGKRSTAGSNMSNRISYINQKLNGFVAGYEDVAAATEFLNGQSKKSAIVSMLNGLPGFGGSYESYYNSYIKSGDWDIYAEMFSWLVNSSTFGTNGTADEKKVISVTKTYLASNGYNANGYDDYMRNQLTDAQEKTDLFKLLTCLKTCHSYAITYKNNIQPYKDADAQIPAAYEELRAATEALAGLESEKSNTNKAVTDCLKAFHTFATNYQSDAYYYNYYKGAAERTIAKEAAAIKTHFSQLQAYLYELWEDLNEISDQIVVVKKAIETYNTNLTNWENANTSYSTTNGSDSFSSQTSDDISKARTEYDAKLYETLDTFVIAMWDEFDELHSKLSDPNNFKYGNTRIDQIDTAAKLKSALSGTSFSDIVTVEEATTKLATLYKAESIEYVPYSMDYTDPPQLGFLSPKIVQIQALKYLNNAYPENAPAGSEQTKAEYESAKSQLTGDASSGGSGDGEATGSFGYTFKSNSLKGGLPSSGKAKEKDAAADKKYQLDETGEGDDAKLDANTSVKDQTKKSNSALDGIANIATTALENLYILDYIFENFSYNTIVQEQILKDNPVKSNTVAGQLTEATALLADSAKITDAKSKTTTLSNFPINEKNNYLYGAEIEYILFGNSNPATNVTSTKASIYAIRFVFNCIFAFTDSEIRNSTMAAGLAVQAATMGIVPYQIVQIVLQLALAAAESAIDLTAINSGIKVAIVKTRDTWSLSISGGAEILKDAANAAADVVTDKVTNLATNAISTVTNGVNDLLDAGADELKGAITDLETNMTTAAQGVLESVVDSVVSSLMSEIENGINELQYITVGQIKDANGNTLDQVLDKDTVKTEARTMFATVRGKVESTVAQACGDNEAAKKLAARLVEVANQFVNDVETEVIAMIDEAEVPDLTGYITERINEMKLTLIEHANTMIENIADDLAAEAENAVSEVKGKLQDYVNKCGEDLTEAAAEEIKKGVSEVTNKFVDTTLKINGPESPVTDTKGSIASMFKFGYKDYLMLLTYISICCGDSALLRTADVIQMNMQHADETKGADFSHGNGSKFKLANAYTYVSITATAELDMFFMDMSIFQSVVSEEETLGPDDVETTAPTEESKGTKITYKGILGY